MALNFKGALKVSVKDALAVAIGDRALRLGLEPLVQVVNMARMLAQLTVAHQVGQWQRANDAASGEATLVGVGATECAVHFLFTISTGQFVINCLVRAKL